MSLLSCLYSIGLVVFLFRVLQKQLQREAWVIDSLGMYCLLALFFFAIPLAFDSVFLLVSSPSKLVALLDCDLESGLGSYWFLDKDIVYAASLYAFLFHIVLTATFCACGKLFRFKKRKAQEKERKTDYFAPYAYCLFGWLGLLVWGSNYGIRLADAGFGYRSSVKDAIGWISLFASWLMFMSYPGIFSAKTKSKQVLCLVLIAAPPAIIGYLTESRATFIGFLLLLLWWGFSRLHKWGNYGIFGIAAGAYFLLLVCISIRSNQWNLVGYPVWRDVSVSDMYYVFKYEDLLYNEGKGFLNLISTGIPFLKVYDPAYEITAKLANFRFFDGWGTLHPTVLGWCYMDNRWFSLLYAAFWGGLLALTEHVRLWLKGPLKLMYLGVVFSAIPCIVRGTCQYAYGSVLFYGTVFFILLNCFGYKVLWNWFGTPDHTEEYSAENQES